MAKNNKKTEHPFDAPDFSVAKSGVVDGVGTYVFFTLPRWYFVHPLEAVQ
jgi:hypothetical protein